MFPLSDLELLIVRVEECVRFLPFFQIDKWFPYSFDDLIALTFCQVLLRLVPVFCVDLDLAYNRLIAHPICEGLETSCSVILAAISRFFDQTSCLTEITGMVDQNV